MIGATKGKSMDGEVLTIGKVVGWSGGVTKGLVSVEARPWSVVSGACFFRLIFERASGAFFFDVGSILGGFGTPKRKPKSIFGTFFFDAFFECVLASILGGFLEARNLENMHGA